MHLDSFASIRGAAKTVRSQTRTSNAIICNAGVMFVPYESTEDGFEAHLGVKHLAHFLLSQELKQLLILGAAQSKHLSRVVCVSSSGQRFSGINFDDVLQAAPANYLSKTFLSHWTTHTRLSN